MLGPRLCWLLRTVRATLRLLAVQVTHPETEAKKTLIEQAYRLGDPPGLSVWTEDKARPFHAIPYPGRAWQSEVSPNGGPTNTSATPPPTKPPKPPLEESGFWPPTLFLPTIPGDVMPHGTSRRDYTLSLCNPQLFPTTGLSKCNCSGHPSKGVEDEADDVQPVQPFFHRETAFIETD